MEFGLVTEGITDQIVLENILYGFFNDKDLPIDPLSPLRDATDEDKATTNSNWLEVFEYCKSSKFKEAVVIKDYVIVQIDTDVLRTNNVSKEYQMSFKHEDGKEFSVEEIVEAVKNKLIETIGEEFYRQFQAKIIFAISVHSIECWLLPIYFKTQKKKAGKIENCLNTLNEALKKSKLFYIDNKEPKYYRAIAEKYKKNKILMDSNKFNPSLKIFIEDLQSREISLE